MSAQLKRSLGMILRVFRRDLRRLLHNPIATIVVIGVLFMPSIYAWYTIAANMDPYAHTDAISVAVANDDEGAESDVAGAIDAGAEIVSKLKDNHELGWQFVTEDEALDGVRSGRYFAAIVIPKNFSTDLISVFSGDFEQPTIDYYVNEKISAVAPEITNVGATTIEAEIDSAFVSQVSETVASIAQKLGKTVETDEGNSENQLSAAVKRARDTIASVDDALASLTDVINTAHVDVGDAESALSDLEGKIPALADDEQSARDQVNALRTAVTSYGSDVSGGLQGAAADASSAALATESDLNQALSQLATRKADLERQLADAEASGDSANATALRAQIDGLNAAQTALTQAGDAVAGALKSLSDSLSQTSSSLADDVLPALERSLDDASAGLGTLRGATVALEPALSAARTALDQLTTTLDATQTAADQARSSLDAIESDLDNTAHDLQTLSSSANVENLSRYLSINTDQLGEFMAAPVKLKTEVIYPVKNYGSGVAPFFTNLALWVAGFILVAIIRLRIDRKGDDDALPPLTFAQSYFGRALLFFLLGVIQGLIVCIGDIVLGIQCDNPAAFVFAGLVTVFVDLNILYALVFTWRHVGRAIGIIVLIMQIPGSSGEYPVQMMPAFFQVIHPLLPFTYSIDAMREAIGGMYGAHYWIDLLCLMPFLACALAFGLIAGRYSYNLNVLFDRELSRTDLLISEDTSGEQEGFRLRPVIQALLASEAYRETLLERMRRFRRRYPRLVRGGWICVAIAALGALVIGRLLGGDIDGKVIALVVVIVLVIAVTGYMIIVEFLDDRLSYAFQVSTLDDADLKTMVRDHLQGSVSTPTETPAAPSPPAAIAGAPAPAGPDVGAESVPEAPAAVDAIPQAPAAAPPLDDIEAAPPVATYEEWTPITVETETGAVVYWSPYPGAPSYLWVSQPPYESGDGR